MFYVPSPDMAAASTFKLQCSMMFKENFLFNSKVKKTAALCGRQNSIFWRGKSHYVWGNQELARHPHINQVAQNKPIDRGLCRTGDRRVSFSSTDFDKSNTIFLHSCHKYSRPCPPVQMINGDRYPP